MSLYAGRIAVLRNDGRLVGRKGGFFCSTPLEPRFFVRSVWAGSSLVVLVAIGNVPHLVVDFEGNVVYETKRRATQTA